MDQLRTATQFRYAMGVVDSIVAKCAYFPPRITWDYMQAYEQSVEGTITTIFLFFPLCLTQLAYGESQHNQLYLP